MSLKPNYESPYLNMAKLLWSVGDAPEAMRYLGLLLDRNPQHEEAKRCKLLFELYVYQEQPLPPRTPISFDALLPKNASHSAKTRTKNPHWLYLLRFSSAPRLGAISGRCWKGMTAANLSCISTARYTKQMRSPTALRKSRIIISLCSA